MAKATQQELQFIRLFMGNLFGEESGSGYHDEDGDIHTQWGDRFEILDEEYRVSVVHEEGYDEAYTGEFLFTRTSGSLVQLSRALNQFMAISINNGFLSD